MTFFFDRHIAFQIVVTLREELSVNAVHLREHFDIGALDVDWLPTVGERGWVLITADHNIRSRKLEKKAMERHRVIAFFCAKELNNKHAHNRLEWFKQHWRAIEQRAAEAQPGEVFVVSWKGKITQLEDT